MSQERDRVTQEVKRAAGRIDRAERERPTLLAQTAVIGVLGLLFVLPVIGGAYLGHWIDDQAAGYSLRWTLSLIFLGVMVGAVNVYFFVRD